MAVLTLRRCLYVKDFPIGIPGQLSQKYCDNETGKLVEVSIAIRLIERAFVMQMCQVRFSDQ